MDVAALSGALATAQARMETQVSLQKKVQDMAAQEMAAVIRMIAPPPSHLGGNVNTYA